MYRPELMTMLDGSPVVSPVQWQVRRELLLSWKGSTTGSALIFMARLGALWTK